MNILDINSTLILTLAYLDPGSGSILIQLLISAIVGAGFYIKVKFGNIKNIFKKSSDKTEDDNLVDDDLDV